MLITIIVDLVLTSFIILGLITGIKRGFIKSVTKPLRSIGAFLIAYFSAKPIAINIVVPLLGGPLANQIESYINEHCSNADSELPTLVKFAAGLTGINIEGATVADVIHTLTNPVVELISVVLTFVLLFFISKLLLTLLFKLLDSVFNSSVLAIPNKILGCVLNTFCGAIVAWCATIAFDFIIHLPMLEGQAWATEFSGGILYEFFLNFSPAELLLSF